MTGLAKSISALYFGYRPAAGHLEGCRYRGTDMWEVTRHIWESFGGKRCEETIRLACHECGVVHFHGPTDGPASSETTHASQVGYASKPEKAGGVWLHPGPRLWRGEERGPSAFYVTRTKDRPRQPGDVLGIVGWHLGRRGGVRWGAGAGCTGHGVKVSCSDDFTSRRAAVAWVVERAELEQAPAAAGV
jgi:hypothetical protein